MGKTDFHNRNTVFYDTWLFATSAKTGIFEGGVNKLFKLIDRVMFVLNWKNATPDIHILHCMVIK